MFDDLVARLLAMPPLALYGVLAALAAIENVFPPVPADSAVAIGAFLTVGGRGTAWGVFLVVWAANVLGAGVVYVAARTVGRSFFRGRIGGQLLNPARMGQIERLYDRHGTWAIFVSRFIPGVRAVVPSFAGVANLDAVRALAPLALASGIWYGTLTFASSAFIRNLDTIREILVTVQGALLALVVAAGLVVLVVWLRWRRTRAPEPE